MHIGAHRETNLESWLPSAPRKPTALLSENLKPFAVTCALHEKQTPRTGVRILGPRAFPFGGHLQRSPLLVFKHDHVFITIALSRAGANACYDRSKPV